MPHNHAKNLCTYHSATPETVQAAIDGALKAKPEWEDMPWADRAAIFLKAADLIAGKYRFEVMAATMLGQGKNAWQAEIDAAAEVSRPERIERIMADGQTIDFLRFSVKYVEQLYAIQPPRNSQGVWNRTEYRPLEGFVLAVTPFNFVSSQTSCVGQELIPDRYRCQPSRCPCASRKRLCLETIPNGHLLQLPNPQDPTRGWSTSFGYPVRSWKPPRGRSAMYRPSRVWRTSLYRKYSGLQGSLGQDRSQPRQVPRIPPSCRRDWYVRSLVHWVYADK